MTVNRLSLHYSLDLQAMLSQCVDPVVPGLGLIFSHFQKLPDLRKAQSLVSRLKCIQAASNVLNASRTVPFPWQLIVPIKCCSTENA